MAFLSTSASLSGSAPGKSLIDPRKPLWQYQQQPTGSLTNATKETEHAKQEKKKKREKKDGNVCQYGVDFNVNVLKDHHLPRKIDLNLLWHITEKNNKYPYWLYAFVNINSLGNMKSVAEWDIKQTIYINRWRYRHGTSSGDSSSIPRHGWVGRRHLRVRWHGRRCSSITSHGWVGWWRARVTRHGLARMPGVPHPLAVGLGHGSSWLWVQAIWLLVRGEATRGPSPRGLSVQRCVWKKCRHSCRDLTSLWFGKDWHWIICAQMVTDSFFHAKQKLLGDTFFGVD